MRDVAHHCGVSESTVSHVLNGTKFVSPELRERILDAVKVMKFHRDSHAKRLASGHSNLLGLIISDIENPFFPGLIKAFETAALSAGFEVLLCTTNYDAARSEDAFRKMIENKSPGVAVMSSRIDPKMSQQLFEHGVASVFLESDKAGLLKSNIKIDYGTGAKAAILYLHNLGHRVFALVAGPQNRPSHRAYRVAVETALKQAKLKVNIIEANNDVISGEAAVHTLLTGPDFPTAILCSNDLTAMSVTRSLFKRGMRVPADVSVVGADDIPFAALTQPPLTTVRMPREQLGLLAFETLQKLIDFPQSLGCELSLPTDLVIRESTGVAPPSKTDVKTR